MIGILITAIASVLLTLALTAGVFAQTSSSQLYRVAVPSSSTVVPPPNVTINYIENQTNSFDPQTWTVIGNALGGITVDFRCEYPFRHVNDPTMKNDASLALSIVSNTGNATWSLTKSADQTNINQNDETAVVQVTSNGVGVATVNLAIQFLHDPLNALAEGQYELIVSANITTL
jgi:hypothetical protein